MKWQTVFVIASAIVLMTAFKAYGTPTRTVGVSVGDWASYLVTYEGNATSEAPEDMVNKTTATFTVLDILGTNVTMQAHGHYLNGSDIIDVGWIDVDTGASSGNITGPGTLIAANLMQGDLVYTNTSVAPFLDGTINETITRNYLGGPVVVNHYAMNISTLPNPYYNMSMSMDWYWYKATGVPAEIAMNYTDELAPFLVTANYAAAATSNMTWYNWHMTVSGVIPEFPAVNIAPVFMIAALLMIIIHKRQARNSQKAHFDRSI